MSLTFKAEHNFGELKKSRFTADETPYAVWREAQKDSTQEVDVLEHLRFNIAEMNDLSSRFQFLLQELSTVLVKKK